MLFSYPLAATTNNWLHQCLCAMLESIHDATSQGQGAPTWDRLIAISGRNELLRRRGLRVRMEAYRTVFATLTPEEQICVRNAVSEQNAIEELLACQSECNAITSLPAAIREQIADLMAPVCV